MVEALLKLIIGIIGLLAFNIIFTNTLYKQKPNTKNVSILVSLTALIIAFVFGFWKVINSLENLKVIRVIDDWYGKFSTNVPLGFLLIWLVIPVLIGFVIYFILAVKKKHSIHKDYEKWQEEEAKKKQPEQVDDSTDSETKEDVQEEQQQAEKTSAVETVPTDTEVLDVQANVKKIDYVTFDGLKKVYNDAKKQLQISKYKKDAYVAVNVNEEGLKELKKIFSENSIDTSSLSTESSVVYFTDSKVQTMSLMSQIDNAKEKKKSKVV